MNSLLRSFKRFLRTAYDSIYCKNWPTIERLGQANAWHVDLDSITEDSIVYSAGVGHDISFEKALVRRFGVTVELFDPSPTGVSTMTLEDNQLPQIRFTPIGLAGTSGMVRFSPPADLQEGSYAASVESERSVLFECKDLQSLMSERGHSRIDLLKMDIEGSEYAVIDHIVENRLNVRQICVEFHHFVPSIPRSTTRRAIAQLRRAGFVLVHKSKYDHTFVAKGRW